MFWVFKLSFVVKILAFFDLATLWAILWKTWRFFSNCLVTLIHTYKLYRWRRDNFWRLPESREPRRWQDTSERRGRCRERSPEVKFRARHAEAATRNEPSGRATPIGDRKRVKVVRRRLRRCRRQHLRPLRRRLLDRPRRRSENKRRQAWGQWVGHKLELSCNLGVIKFSYTNEKLYLAQ